MAEELAPLHLLEGSWFGVRPERLILPDILAGGLGRIGLLTGLFPGNVVVWPALPLL